MGTYLASHGLRPDLVVLSPSRGRGRPGSKRPPRSIRSHNPSLQELAVRVVCFEHNNARRRLKEKFPKAALAVVDFSVKNWSRVRPRRGRLERFLTAHQTNSAPE
jgi:phosphohistidine phosphatase SixA